MQAIRIPSGSQSEGTSVCRKRIWTDLDASNQDGERISKRGQRKGIREAPMRWQREPALKPWFPPKFGAKHIFLLSKFASTFLSFPPSTPRYPRAIASAQLGFSSSVAAGLRVSSADHIHQGHSTWEFVYHMVPGFGVGNHELASRSAERFQGKRDTLCRRIDLEIRRPFCPERKSVCALESC
ncbi:hypothetical protein MUK42_37658 [Musa troglodytarum]|uniref:Uncharacterized protein n=1 Tax=Musa troglodytarum TaxID=320322 RepID=A0A9E7EEY8_9LILI|nr:hypothetical protein MUK42_37658 [Musa troglodytarum]